MWSDLYYHGDQQWQEEEWQPQDVEESEGDENLVWSELVGGVVGVQVGEGKGHKGCQHHLQGSHDTVVTKKTIAVSNPPFLTSIGLSQLNFVH